MAAKKALLLVLFFILSESKSEDQVHYVPAQVLIPTLNVSGAHIFQNKTNTVNNTGWNNPLLNKTAWTWNQTTPNGDLIVGKIHYMDHRLFNQMYWTPARWWSSREKIVAYPQALPGSYGRHETISAIRVFNQYMNGGGSKAEIISGGIGKRFAKIKLTSNFGNGFKFLVQIYGH